MRSFAWVMGLIVSGASLGAVVAQTIDGLDLDRVNSRKVEGRADAEALARTVARRADALRQDALAVKRAGETNLRSNGAVLKGGTTGPIDFDEIVQQAAGSDADGGAPQFIVFASLSMPPESLKPLIRDTARAGGVVVFRGFPNNSMQAFQQAMARVVERGQPTDNVGIDPRLFRAFGVNQVPAFVVAATDFEVCDGFECETVTPPHDRLSGNVTVGHALETIATGQGPGAAIAVGALKRLRRPM